MKALNISKNDDFITIETHFGVPEHFIRADTRNKCSEDLVAMLQEISKILFPDDGFDIYLLPPEPGSYRDIIKFVKKNKVGSVTAAVVTVGSLFLGYLNYKDSHEAHLNESKTWVIDETTKCLELQKKLEELGETYEIENIDNEKLREVCGNMNLIKRKNNFYNVLKGDGMISNNETILKDNNSKIISAKKIERVDFYKYIEPIQDQKYSQESIEGVVELISPVVKQKQEGRGIAWRGIYYGEDIFFREVSVLKNGDDIEFYMQDQDFKGQISNNQRAFAVNDNMKIIFDMTGELKGGLFLNRSIYIKEVSNYNEEVIPHKIRLTRRLQEKQENQSGLFDNIL